MLSKSYEKGNIRSLFANDILTQLGINVTNDDTANEYSFIAALYHMIEHTEFDIFPSNKFKASHYWLDKLITLSRIRMNKTNDYIYIL